jgi:Mg2+/Co2+ transporter CorB
VIGTLAAVGRFFTASTEGWCMNELLTLVPSLVAIAVLVGLSAFFSSSESAIFSLSADWLASTDAAIGDAVGGGDADAVGGGDADAVGGDDGDADAAVASGNATVLDALREDPHRLLVTILVGNNLVNIAISSLITLLVVEFVRSGLAVVVATLVASVLILVFGEIVPKAYGLGHAQSWSLRVARPLSLVGRALGPVVTVFDSVTSVLTALVGGDRDIEEPYLDE